MTATDRLPLVSSQAHPALRFALVAAPCAWIAQGLIVWWVGERLCRPLSVGTARGLIGAVSIVALGVAVAALVVGVRQGHRLDAAIGRDIAPAAAGVARFAVTAGIFVSAAFAVGIVWAGLSSVWLSGCGAMR
ncbi:MAG TPA: hypothetical protein VG538_13640 [Vicinamibacterales bacterium]|jgi:hypothetical protein|nr:hypothetical protein [Vicinamibacterales bacterium]